MNALDLFPPIIENDIQVLYPKHTYYKLYFNEPSFLNIYENNATIYNIDLCCKDKNNNFLLANNITEDITYQKESDTQRFYIPLKKAYFIDKTLPSEDFFYQLRLKKKDSNECSEWSKQGVAYIYQYDTKPILYLDLSNKNNIKLSIKNYDEDDEEKKDIIKLTSASLNFFDERTNILLFSHDIVHTNDDGIFFSSPFIKISKDMKLIAKGVYSSNYEPFLKKYEVDAVYKITGEKEHPIINAFSSTLSTTSVMTTPINNIISDGFILLQAQDQSDNIRIIKYTDELYDSGIIKKDNIQVNKKYKDYSIENGKKYFYNIQSYGSNDNIDDTDDTIILDLSDYKDGAVEASATFEDMFLLGGDEEIYKIAFDQTVDSYKRNISVNKVETIGSQYPYITDGGNIDYSTFNISGLISKLNDGGSYEGDAVIEEKIFRDKFLEFVHKKRPLLFKTPTEGNFIVRLTDVSFTPKTELGRMIWSFSATATEIDKFSIENLDKYNIKYLYEIEG